MYQHLWADYLCPVQKIGILGGGQLGRMLLQAAANYPVETYVLENDADCPAAHLCHHFTLGDIKDFNTVYNFGQSLDAITIEIENVNIEALKCWKKKAKKYFPGLQCSKPSKIKYCKKNIISVFKFQVRPLWLHTIFMN
jgi:5-(carboxyamino)imidazole ribonucleotide synthase